MFSSTLTGRHILVKRPYRPYAEKKTRSLLAPRFLVHWVEGEEEKMYENLVLSSNVAYFSPMTSLPVFLQRRKYSRTTLATTARTIPKMKVGL